MNFTVFLRKFLNCECCLSEIQLYLGTLVLSVNSVFKFYSLIYTLIDCINSSACY